MTKTTPNPDMLDLAQRLLTYESARDCSEENTPAPFLVSEKLRRPLSRIAGTDGFRSLIERALILARARVPALSTVQIKPDGSLDGLGAIADNDQSRKAGIVLIAQLLTLLAVFIGEGLVLNLILEAWPDLPAPEPIPLEKK